jgi:hypothetical protein
MAMYRYGYASVVHASVTSDDWTNKVYTGACKDGQCRMKTAKSIIAKYSPDKYILSHCSIIASVDTDCADPKDPKTDYLIKPEFSKFVNNNGDAWTKEVLKNSYKSFIGGENYCFPAGTRVLMSDGTYRGIDQIKVGDKVINRYGKVDTVSKIYERDVDTLTEIKSNNILSRSLFTTKEHPFWVYRARKTCPKTGRPNSFDRDRDFWMLDSWKGFSVGVHEKVGEDFPLGLTPDWVEAGKLDINRDFLTHPVSDIETDNLEINENRAELLGWYLSEGYLNKINKFSDNVSSVTFCLGNTELIVANRLSQLLIEEFGKTFRTDCQPRIYESPSGSYSLSLCNEEAALFFEKWGGRLAYSKKLNSDALYLPKKLQALILKHCINGDGCNKLDSRGYILEIKSQDLIQQLIFISWRLGLCPTYKETGVLPRYSECEDIDGYEIYTDPITGKKSRPGYMLRYSTRDSKKLNNFLGIEDKNISSRLSKSYSHILNDSENHKWLISKIDSITSSDVKCKVYNIEVSEDNSYVVEGVIVHNCEHVQIPELSKGKIIDAVLREIPIGKDKDGKELTTLYCDILVATDKKHEDLVRKIQTGEMAQMSMGCLIKHSTCSKCGNRAVDETQACDHIRYQKNNTFFDNNGVQRKIAELCGYKEEPDSVRFIEASWVKQPAFTGAVLRSFVAPSEEIMAKLEKAEKVEAYKKNPGDYLKAAGLADIIAQEPADKEELPVEPDPAEDTTDVPPPEDTPLGEEPAIPEGMEEDEFKSWKKDLKKQVLRQITDEVMKGLSDEDEGAPRDTDTLDETLIKPASLVMNKIWGAQKSWDRFVRQKAGSLDKKSYDKLRYGIHIAMTNPDLTTLRDYGYSKRDFLAVLSFIDGCMKNPLPLIVKKTISNMGGTQKKSAKELLTTVVTDLGRKITRDEACKILSWLRLMDYYKD